MPWYLRLLCYVVAAAAIPFATAHVAAFFIQCRGDCTNELAALGYGAAALVVCVIAPFFIEAALYRRRRRTP